MHTVQHFRVREKPDGSFVLSLSFSHEAKHYMIKREKGHGGTWRFAIEDGPKFENIMDVSTSQSVLICYSYEGVILSP